MGPKPEVLVPPARKTPERLWLWSIARILIATTFALRLPGILASPLALPSPSTAALRLTFPQALRTVAGIPLPGIVLRICHSNAWHLSQINLC